MKQSKRIKEHIEEVFVEAYAETGNATKAMQAARPNLSVAVANNAAHRMLQKPDVQVKLESKLQRMSNKALKTIKDSLDSEDEKVATINARWVIEQVHGKALQRNVSLNSTVNVEDILSIL